MTNPWFRMYHEFATDPKVQMLSEADQRRYVMLLCLRCSNGDVTLHNEEVAFQLRISNDEWAQTKERLVEKGLIGEDNKPAAWDKRQYKSDTSNERVKAYRKRKKEESNDTESEEKQGCNVTVTPPDTDTDTDTDTDINSAKKKPARKATKINPEFQVTDKLRQWASVNAPSVDVDWQTQKIINYFTGEGKTKKDWDATWRNWIMNAVERSGKPKASNSMNQFLNGASQ